MGCRSVRNDLPDVNATQFHRLPPDGQALIRGWCNRGLEIETNSDVAIVGVAYQVLEQIVLKPVCDRP